MCRRRPRVTLIGRAADAAGLDAGDDRSGCCQQVAAERRSSQVEDQWRQFVLADPLPHALVPEVEAVAERARQQLAAAEVEQAERSTPGEADTGPSWPSWRLGQGAHTVVGGGEEPALGVDHECVFVQTLRTGIVTRPRRTAVERADCTGLRTCPSADAVVSEHAEGFARGEPGVDGDPGRITGAVDPHAVVAAGEHGPGAIDCEREDPMVHELVADRSPRLAAVVREGHPGAGTGVQIPGRRNDDRVHDRIGQTRRGRCPRQATVVGPMDPTAARAGENSTVRQLAQREDACPIEAGEEPALRACRPDAGAVGRGQHPTIGEGDDAVHRGRRECLRRVRPRAPAVAGGT